jgi:nucleoside 2-deoxyribosyltransferase
MFGFRKNWREIMINEIRYETFQKDVDYSFPSVFLAGPTVRGNQKHLVSWRKDAVRLFNEYGFKGNLIIPEFSNNSESDEVRYDLPLWEFEGLRRSNVIMFWIPRTRELIGLTTNHEIGYWMARDREKIVYGRPRDAFRMAYVDIMWVEDYKDRFGKNSGAKIHTTLESTVKGVIEKVEEFCPCENQTSVE